MAREEHLDTLREGVDAWNRWREEHPDVTVDLREVDLRGLNLKGADLGEVDLRGANLSGGNLREAYLNGADLRGTNLREADLKGSQACRADLSQTILSGANLSRSNLKEARLHGADLHDADLHQADLFSADLRGANLRGANLVRASLDRADLQDADLEGAAVHDETGVIEPVRSDTRPLPLEFTGEGTEYFRIWVVNVFLSVITLGIYSAWAKVRRTQYFYGHTQLAGSPFDYLANPVKILKGRLIVIGAVGVFIAVANYYPVFLILVVVVVIPFFPWLINKALMFKTRNTAYRNIRFNFNPSYRRSFWVFVVLSVLSITGWLYPLFHHRRKKYLYNNIRYGRTPFRFQGLLGHFFWTWFIAGLIGGIVFLFGESIGRVTGSEMLGTLYNALMAAGIFLYVQVHLTNYSWEMTRLGDIRFQSLLDFQDFLIIYATNAALIVLTLGVYIPWARVRVFRYRVEKLAIMAEGGLDGFLADAKEAEVTASGEEVGEFFGFDFGL